KVITVSGKVEKMIAENIQQTEHGNYLSLDPDSQQKLVKNIQTEVESLRLQEETAVLLCSPAIRMYLKQLLNHYLPQVVVLSYNELEPDVHVQSVGGEYSVKVKKYVAPTMPEVMSKIRKELGPDAVILNSKEIKRGGFFGFFEKRNIEVVAALDPE